MKHNRGHQLLVQLWNLLHHSKPSGGQKEAATQRPARFSFRDHVVQGERGPLMKPHVSSLSSFSDYSAALA